MPTTLVRRSVAALLTLGLFACDSPTSSRPASPIAAERRRDGEQRVVEFDAPGASAIPGLGATFAFANNDRGDIVGFYVDTNVVPHGFLRHPDGRFTTIDAPGAGTAPGQNQGTVLYSINSSGEIAGQFQDTAFVFHAFVRTSRGHFKVFDAPKAVARQGQGTAATSINEDGATAGIWIDSNSVIHGFVRERDGTFESFDAPHAGTGAFQGTLPCQETCINAKGDVTGAYVDPSNGLHGFIRKRDKTFVEFNVVDDSVFGGGASINADGAVTGYGTDANNVATSFTRSRHGDIDTFQVPGASLAPNGGTAAFALSSIGGVTGQFTDAKGVNRGFFRSRERKYSVFSANGAGTGATQGTRPSTVNDYGMVVGWYIDASGVSHGFFWNER